MTKKKNYKANIPVPRSASWMRKKQVSDIDKVNKERAMQMREIEMIEKAANNMFGIYSGM